MDSPPSAELNPSHQSPLVCCGCGSAVVVGEAGYVVLPPPTLAWPPIMVYHDSCGRTEDRRFPLARYRSIRSHLPALPPRERVPRNLRRARAFQVVWQPQRPGRWREIQGPQLYIVRDHTAIRYIGQTMKTTGVRLRQHMADGDRIGSALLDEHAQLWQRMRTLLRLRSSTPLPDVPEPMYYEVHERRLQQMRDEVWVEYIAVQSSHNELDLVEQALIARYQPTLNVMHSRTTNPLIRWRTLFPLDTEVRLALLSAPARWLIHYGWPVEVDGSRQGSAE